MCRFPFIVTKYEPDLNAPVGPNGHHGLEIFRKRVHLTSVKPLKCYGDATILSKMKLIEEDPDQNLDEVLGPIGDSIPDTFARIDD